MTSSSSHGGGTTGDQTTVLRQTHDHLPNVAPTGAATPLNDHSPTDSSRPRASVALAAVGIGLVVAAAAVLVVGPLRSVDDDDPTQRIQSVATGPVQAAQPPPAAAGTGTGTGTDDAASVTAWRAAVEQAGLNPSSLSNDDIVEFGRSFCQLAATTADRSSFDAARDEATSGVEGSLAPADFRLAVDAALDEFCPADAARLGPSGGAPAGSTSG